MANFLLGINCKHTIVITQLGSNVVHSPQLRQLIPLPSEVAVALPSKPRALARRLGGNRDHTTRYIFEKWLEYGNVPTVTSCSDEIRYSICKSAQLKLHFQATVITTRTSPELENQL